MNLKVSDCLSKSRDDLTNASYFSEISQRLESIIAEAHEKAPENLAFLSKMVKQVLMIISRPARILECLVISLPRLKSNLNNFIDTEE